MYIASFIFPFFKIKKAQTYFIWYEERKVSSIHMQYSNNNLEYRENFSRALVSSPPTAPYSRNFARVAEVRFAVIQAWAKTAAERN